MATDDDEGRSRVDDERGRGADRPHEVPARGWKDIAVRTGQEAKSDNVVLMAAGVAFFALLALVPALLAIVSVYGLVADPAEVSSQIDDALAAAPTEVRDLVDQQLTSVTEQSSGGLGLGLVVGLVLALWSASGGMKHLMTAINEAYDEEETRGFVALRGTALLLTLGAIVFVVLAVGVITVVPTLLDDTALGSAAKVVMSLLRWPLLGLGLVAGLAVLYRYGPDRDEPQWTWTAPGTIVAVVLWLIASIGFSIYTSNFALLRRDLRLVGCRRGAHALADDLGRHRDHRRRDQRRGRAPDPHRHHRGRAPPHGHPRRRGGRHRRSLHRRRRPLMAIAIGVVVVLVVAVGSALLARVVQHPEQTATHDDVETGPEQDQRFYEGVDRPAGPDAEDPVGPTRLDEGDVPPGPGRD